MSIFDDLVEEIQNDIRLLLNTPDKIPNYMTQKQLNAILDEISKMAYIKNPKKFYPYYPKGMADACWIADHPLVIKLNRILDIYINQEIDGED